MTDESRKIRGRAPQGGSLSMFSVFNLGYINSHFYAYFNSRGFEYKYSILFYISCGIFKVFWVLIFS